ncbi:hypothetical protein [Polyangium mundeleinium]|uniref:Uncharacterized protein n=1 Tax=Polyangium mundeleinium TaxID=2995306 RepID=A0ABT5EJZ5_9BACT|nr:hypothetical protein [Polyangium mundeleinium]MDC0741267.1 hypothetical protein [Polyangium mundeleinium]
MRASSPKTRRAAFAALVIAAAAALILGARGPDEDDSMYKHCEDDLGYVFEGCHGWDVCPYVDEEFVDACVAGCVSTICPEQAECTGLDPMFCAPCDDMQGAAFWRNVDEAGSRCGHKAGFFVLVEEPTEAKYQAMYRAFDECFPVDVEQHCPALARTDWLTHFDAVTPFPRKRTLPARAPAPGAQSSSPR